jgi:hypothetical protein
MLGEPKLHLTGKALTARDIYRHIRESINDCRARGIEPKKVWVSQYVADCMHEMWVQVASKYDLKLPLGVANVPMFVGSGLGRNKFVFEYDEDKEKGHTLRRGPVANPLPDNE